MNKPIITSVFAFIILNLISTKTFSQHHIGISMGYGIPYYKTTASSPQTTTEYEPYHAYILEITYKNRWPGIFNIGGDINFINRSVHIDQSQNTFTANLNSSNDFSLFLTNIDVFGELTFGNKIKYYFQIGPALSFMIFSQIDGFTEIESNDGSGQKIKTYNDGGAEDYFSIFNTYLYTAIGIDYPINENWYLSGKFQYQNEFLGLSANSYATRGIYFQLGVTYILPTLGHKL